MTLHSVFLIPQELSRPDPSPKKKKRSRPFSCWNRCPRAILVTAVTSGLRRSRAIFLGSIESISWGPLGVGEELTLPETSAGVGWTLVWKGRCCPLPGAHLAIKILCNNGRGSLWTQATQLLSSKPLNTYFSFCSPPSLSLVPRGCPIPHLRAAQSMAVGGGNPHSPVTPQFVRIA